MAERVAVRLSYCSVHLSPGCALLSPVRITPPPAQEVCRPRFTLATNERTAGPLARMDRVYLGFVCVGIILLVCALALTGP
jgi:hypothetical protein